MQEYFSIIEYLINKVDIKDDKIILDNKIFYSFLDKNLYMKRSEKLRIYKQLNLIICGKKGFSMSIYDKDSKKSKRKIVLNMKTYETIKALYTKFDD